MLTYAEGFCQNNTKDNAGRVVHARIQSHVPLSTFHFFGGFSTSNSLRMAYIPEEFAMYSVSVTKGMTVDSPLFINNRYWEEWEGTH